MVRHLYDIGCGRYQFDRATLDSFMEESRNRLPKCQPDGAQNAVDAREELSDQEMQRIFEEVMALYHDYNRCRSVDLLLRLKSRLEEFSTRYQSHVLAAEVLNINSCLPYEQRITRTDPKSRQ